MKVSVLTPTILQRGRFLKECKASVASQTLDEVEHLVKLDHNRDGCSVTMNRLAAEATGEWFFPFADDDIMLPHCLELHYRAALETDADIVYAPPLVWGEPHHGFRGRPPNIPAPALIRAELWRSLSGYREDVWEQEDRRLFEKAMMAGARFVRADAHPTWVYRFHGGNKSRGQLPNPRA